KAAKPRSIRGSSPLRLLRTRRARSARSSETSFASITNLKTRSAFRPSSSTPIVREVRPPDHSDFASVPIIEIQVISFTIIAHATTVQSLTGLFRRFPKTERLRHRSKKAKNTSFLRPLQRMLGEQYSR